MGEEEQSASRDHDPAAGIALEKADPARRDKDGLVQVAWEVQAVADFGGLPDQSERDAMAALAQRALYLRERLRAIIDWADLALSMPQEFDSHGVRNLDGPVFDAAREFLSAMEAGDASTAKAEGQP